MIIDNWIAINWIIWKLKCCIFFEFELLTYDIPNDFDWIREYTRLKIQYNVYFMPILKITVLKIILKLFSLILKITKKINVFYWHYKINKLLMRIPPKNNQVFCVFFF